VNIFKISTLYTLIGLHKTKKLLS